MEAIKAGMSKEKVVQLLQLFPEIDGEIRVRRNIVNDLEQYYYTTPAVNYDGMPHAKYSTGSPTENAALKIPDYVHDEIQKYTAEITDLQKVKVEILKEVSRLKLKYKNVIFGFYFHGMKWEQVANGTHYSERQCKNIRDEALLRLLQGFSRNRVLVTYRIEE